jgi:MOSC domain-containing protein YiiM
MTDAFSNAFVVAVSFCAAHQFSKPVQKSIRLLAGLGAEGDAHLGVTVQHRSRIAKDPTQPNLRQVHLIHEEPLNELNASGFGVGPGTLGENVLTRGINLLELPRGARLHIGNTAIVEVTGLRDPCRQLDDYRPGLMAAVLSRDSYGNLVRKAGIMSTVLSTGSVEAGDLIRVELPLAPHLRLERV